MTPLDILVFGAHADDAEIGMAGTILRHTRAGRAVGICDLTCAELSSNGTVELRKQEAEEASRLLGLSIRTNLGLPDRALYITPQLVETVAMEIRRHRPRLVFAPYWQDRHPDHVSASRLVEEAVFTAKLRRFRPDVEPVTVEAVYFYFINDPVEPDLQVNVTDVYPDKIKALQAYRSQFEPVDTNLERVETPLTQSYIERVEARDRLLGMKKKAGYAEGFMTRLPYDVDLF